MTTHKKVKLQIYPSTVHVIKAKNLDEAVGFLSKDLKVKVTGDHSSFKAFTTSAGAHVYILLSEEFKSSITEDFAHEALHAVLEVLNYVNIPIRYENAEVLCYLNGFIIKAFKDFIHE